MAETALVWLRYDLRIADNPALAEALKHGRQAVALYVDETDEALRPRGAASRWWLHHSLRSLAEDLATLGVPLAVERGPAVATLLDFARAHRATAVFCNRRYGPAERAIDGAIKQALREQGISVESFAANVLVEPFEMQTGAGKPYSVIVCAGSDGTGAMTQTDRIGKGLRLRKVHPGIVYTSGVTAQVQVVPSDVLQRCRDLGALIAAGIVHGVF